MQALIPNVNKNAMWTIAQKVLNCPYDSILAILIPVNGNDGGAGSGNFHWWWCSSKSHRWQRHHDDHQANGQCDTKNYGRHRKERRQGSFYVVPVVVTLFTMFGGDGFFLWQGKQSTLTNSKKISYLSWLVRSWISFSMLIDHFCALKHPYKFEKY